MLDISAGQLQEMLIGAFTDLISSRTNLVESLAVDRAVATVSLGLRDPEAAVFVDLRLQVVREARADDSPDAHGCADANLAHRFWLGQLNPVTIGRAFETASFVGSGPPAALQLGMRLVALLGPHWRKSVERIRPDLLFIDMPDEPYIWTL
jgi:hypothetical protein